MLGSPLAASATPCQLARRTSFLSANLTLHIPELRTERTYTVIYIITRQTDEAQVVPGGDTGVLVRRQPPHRDE
jgi:hypothetical protein